MKKIVLSVLLIAIAILSIGCSKNNNIEIGTYIEDGEITAFRIIVNDEKTVTFTNILLSSFPPKGNYIVEDDKLTVDLENGSQYVFEIKDSSLIFNASESSIMQGSFPVFNIEDGKVFVLTDSQ